MVSIDFAYVHFDLDREAFIHRYFFRLLKVPLPQQLVNLDIIFSLRDPMHRPLALTILSQNVDEFMAHIVSILNLERHVVNRRVLLTVNLELVVQVIDLDLV